MAEIKNDNILIGNARIMFRNFSGEASKFNRAGDRNFCVIISDSDFANQLKDEGWNVRIRTYEDSDPVYYIPVSVSFKVIPPNIYMITSNNKVKLTEDNVDELDHAEFVNIDLTIRPYHWEVNGKTGIKAYLKTMYATIEEDEWSKKYEEEEEMPFA